MTVRRNIKKPVEPKKRVDSMIRPVENYKQVIGTKKEREGVHLLFGKYQSRTADNLKKRLDEIGWSHTLLDRLEELKFIEKAEFSKKVGQLHYLRRLFRK